MNSCIILSYLMFVYLPLFFFMIQLFTWAIKVWIYNNLEPCWESKGNGEFNDSVGGDNDEDKSDRNNKSNCDIVGNKRNITVNNNSHNDN